MARKSGSRINPTTGVTDGKLKSMLRSAVRRVASKSSRRVYIDSVKVPNDGIIPNKRCKWVIYCEECGKPGGVHETETYKTKAGKTRRRKVMQCDHITPCGSMVDIKRDLGEYAHNLIFHDLQILCYKCHLDKTVSENTKN